MASQETELEKSMHMFESKKNACLGLAERVIALKTDFDRDFPGNQNGRLSLGKVGAIRDKIADEKLKILVAGQFKTGKSTLLNAMLGDDVLPADVLPCTAVITEIEYGARPAAELYFREYVKKMALPENLRDDVKNHIASSSGEVPAPMKIDLSREDALADYLTIPVGVDQKEGVRESPYSRCLLKWPLELCRSGALIIDSPGLNEHESRDATTMGYLEQADMVVHVLNAQQLCGMPDKKFIEEVRARGQSNFPIIFVVNRFDQISDKNQQKIREYAYGLKELNASYGREGIFFTAAQKALDARLSGNAEALSASGLEAMEKKIADVFVKDRMRIKLGHIAELNADLDEFSQHTLPDMQKMLGKNINELEAEFKGKQAEIDDLEKRVSRIREKVDRSIQRYDRTFSRELGLFFKEFIDVELPEIVEGAELEIDAFNREESQIMARDALNRVVNEALKEGFRNWCYNDARELEKDAIAEISAEIVDDIREFNKDLGRLRSDLGLKAIDFGDLDTVGIGDYLPDLLAGAGIGGAMGGAAAFIATRFLPVIAGPVGWAIAILTTIASIYLLMDNERARKKFRANYLAQAQAGLRKKLDSQVNEIASTYTQRFGKGMDMLYKLLRQRIDDARKPMQAAIAALKSGGAELNEKREKLAAYEKEFNELRLQARGIMAGL